jgi:hypothetical protein
MELSRSWQAISRSATQEFSKILRKPKSYYRVHKSPPLFPILSQINPVPTTISYFSKVHLILSSHPRLSIPSSLFKILHRHVQVLEHKILSRVERWKKICPVFLYSCCGVKPIPLVSRQQAGQLYQSGMMDERMEHSWIDNWQWKPRGEPAPKPLYPPQMSHRLP